MHFIPSTPEYYKHQFNISDARSKKVVDFIRFLFNTISKKVPSTDYVLFDCPPSYTPLLHSALNYSDVFLIPVNTDKFGHRTVEGLCNFLSMLNLKEKRPKPPVGCVFANRVTTTKGVNAGAFCKEDFSEYLRIKKEVDLSNFIFTQTWIPERSAISRSLKEFELNDEQIRLIQPLWVEIDGKCW
jgi:chromosome partitioning protein